MQGVRPARSDLFTIRYYALRAGKTCGGIDAACVLLRIAIHALELALDRRAVIRAVAPDDEVQDRAPHDGDVDGPGHAGLVTALAVDPGDTD